MSFTALKRYTTWLHCSTRQCLNNHNERPEIAAAPVKITAFAACHGDNVTGRIVMKKGLSANLVYQEEATSDILHHRPDLVLPGLL
jgi:hypothetical protein